MKSHILTLASVLTAVSVQAIPQYVDESYDYLGPAIPVGDLVDLTVDGDGNGFIRLYEAPAVTPSSGNPTNNVNVISLAYIPDGINIHFQTAFGLGTSPSLNFGTSATALTNTATGLSTTYDRTPPCSSYSAVTQCSQWFHDVQLTNLSPDTTYYYQIPAENGTTISDVLTFTTAKAAGTTGSFSMALLNDMGYTNAAGTYQQLLNAISAVTEPIEFALHGGDISYADDWYSGITPCVSDWPVCYNGTSSSLPGGLIDDYDTPLSAGEIPNQGSPEGGDISMIYESNWDLWQNWMSNITSRIPYMVMPGNHEVACAEGSGPAYLTNGDLNDTEPTTLTYWDCPASQRNFTAFMHRFRMPGEESGGVSNMWYSFDYGLAHFIAMDGETDYANSTESSFASDLTPGETEPLRNETKVLDAGPFGYVNGSIYDIKAYEQYNWLSADLAAVNRTKTPWIIAMSHRPMYSSAFDTYMPIMRANFEELMLKGGVDAYISGHIHWYERMYPMALNSTIDYSSIKDKNTYYTNEGVSMTHIVNGMAGNVEFHSTWNDAGHCEENCSTVPLPFTNVLNMANYGFTKLTVVNETAAKFTFVEGDSGNAGDEFWLLRPGNNESESMGNATSTVITSNTASANKINLLAIVSLVSFASYLC